MVENWNRIPRVRHASYVPLRLRSDRLPEPGANGMLPFGNGRSYGDVCLNENGTLLLTREIDRFIAFDPKCGRLKCESGVLLDDIIDLVVFWGWFLPVVPGTRMVTVGGAIANDVHGKNHHAAGSFGDYVKSIELRRSSGEYLSLTRADTPALFAATVGGLGLTGLICSAELQLQPIKNAFMSVQYTRFDDLEAFYAVNSEAEKNFSYTVAWIDCLGSSRGRGINMAARHASVIEEPYCFRQRRWRMVIDPPFSLVRRCSLKAFNTLYYRRPLPSGEVLSHYHPYFFPLDSLLDWNRIYGRSGFYQYQCVLPPETGREGIRRLLERIAVSGQGSFLAVLKTFGNKTPSGMLSFARPGITLAMDFPNRKERTLSLFKSLDAVVAEAGGALYPAKDARMPASMFKHSFPRWEEFAQHVDPAFSSSFWRRVSV